MKPSEKDLERIVDDLEVGFVCYFHRITGEIVSLPPEDEEELESLVGDGWQESIDKVKNDPVNFIEFYGMDSRDSYRVMENFAHSLAESPFKEDVLAQLSMHRPFRRFKDLVEVSEYREDWFAFRKQAFVDWVKSQMDDVNWEPVKPKDKEAVVDIYVEEADFENVNFFDSPPERGEYSHCTFTNCDFSNVDLSEFRFVESKFIDCNLSMVDLNGTALQNVGFEGCKMVGLQFDHCRDFGFVATFDRCALELSSFFEMFLRLCSFTNCQLRSVDFEGADLKGMAMRGCDLLDAKFGNTVLAKADLRGSTGYAIDPETNDIRKAKFSMPDVLGLLYRYDITIEH